MTQPLYHQDPYLKTATATVTGCSPTEHGFAVTLDQTIFFPEGGGQPGDVGTIAEVAVTDTYLQEEQTLHLCTAPLQPGETVSLVLNWEKRFDHMQQHTGEHILSYAFWKLFGAVNVGFHMNEQIATIDLNQLLTRSQIRQGVLLANAIITENRPVHCYWAKVKELDKKRVRKISEKGGANPRVVEIEGADICTCCGTHLSFTGQVGSIAVIRDEKNRGGSRLTFLCGSRVVADHLQKTEVLHELTSALSTDSSQLTIRIADMKQELQTLRLQIKEKNQQLFEMQAKELLANRGSSPYVMACLDEASAGEAKTLLNLLVQEQPVTAFVVFTKGESLSFLCAANPNSAGVSCQTVCDLLCGIYNGKGGGKPNFAQGGAKATADFKQLAAMILAQLNRM